MAFVVIPQKPSSPRKRGSTRCRGAGGYHRSWRSI